MKVTQEKLPASRVGLEIEITPEMSQKAYDKTLQNLMRNANIPGFRKGKVPRQVLMQRFGSQQIKALALEDLIQDSLKQAVEQEKLDVLSNFELRSPFEDLVGQFEPGVSITFSAAADVPPDATLSQSKGLQLQAEEVAYDPAKVDQLLENYRERMATRVPVEGRPAQEKDLAVLDFSGYLAKEDPNSDEDPQEIPGGSAEDFELELVEGRFIPGFIEGIIGMSVGETRDVSATFPDPYVQPDLAGKPAVFTITLKELKEKELPELDDDFAQEVSEFETLDELRKSLEERFQKEAEDKTSGNKQEALLKELVKYLEVDLPETLVRREIDYMVTQTAMQFANQGMDIKSIFTPELVQTMRERSRPEAIARIQRTMALGEIAKQESITVEQPEITAKMQEVLQDLQGQQDIDIDRVRQVVEEDLLRDKIFDWLEANNTIELVPEGTLTQDEDETESEPTAELVPEVEAAEAVVEVEATPVVEPEPESAAETKAPAKAKKGKSTAAPAAEATAEPEAEAEEPAAKPARKKSTKKKAEPSEES